MFGDEDRGPALGHVVDELPGFFPVRGGHPPQQGVLIWEVEFVNTPDDLPPMNQLSGVGGGFPNQARHLLDVMQKFWPSLIKCAFINVWGDQDHEFVHAYIILALVCFKKRAWGNLDNVI
ncbi:MAG: hypothetical protein MAG431_00662 [Chloroflexi bacterium]|nr:hypothetical protein [Chloroflexota bacterium]